MLIRSQLYGKFQIGEPVIIDLIRSDELQRLKGISQMGVPDKYYHLEGYSRFEHSLGVMLLLRRLGASKESQIAGLTHDISHTAFSHVVDWLKGNSTAEDFQDKQHEDYFLNSEVSEILRKHGYSPERIANYENFPFLEREIPELCADRVDYTLRELDPEVVKKLVRDLTTREDQVVFKSRSSAKKFANGYLDKQVNHWAGFEAVSRYDFLARALKSALESDIINFEDFWEQDGYIVKKLEMSNNEQIQKILDVLKKDSLKDLPRSKRVRHKKNRYIDPLFTLEGKLERLSQVDEEFNSRLKKVQEKTEQGTILPKLPR